MSKGICTAVLILEVFYLLQELKNAQESIEGMCFKKKKKVRLWHFYFLLMAFLLSHSKNNPSQIQETRYWDWWAFGCVASLPRLQSNLWTQQGRVCCISRYDLAPSVQISSWIAALQNRNQTDDFKTVARQAACLLAETRLEAWELNAEIMSWWLKGSCGHAW